MPLHTLLVTHDGRFHADDALSIAILRQLNRRSHVVRSRDMKIIESANFAVDVGGIYDPNKGRFDHHQKGGAGARESSGISFASAGLVWMNYGQYLTHKLDPSLTPEETLEVFMTVDSKYIAPVDAVDNGEGDRRDSPLSSVIGALNPAWPNDSKEEVDAAFETAVDLAENYLLSQIRKELGLIQAKKRIQSHARREGGLLIVDEAIPLQSVIHQDSSIIFTVQPRRNGSGGVVMTVPVEHGSFESRKDLPEAWAGLTDDALAKVTGVSDAKFCHNNLFIAVAGSFDGAIKLARLAIQ